MSTEISNAIYTARSYYRGFEKLILFPTIAAYCAQEKGFRRAMEATLPLLMLSAWKGKVRPNESALLGDVESVFLYLLEKNRNCQHNGRLFSTTLHELFIMSDNRIEQILYDLHKKDVQRQYRPNVIPKNQVKRKESPWARRLTIITATLARTMATTLLEERYWALTQVTYEPSVVSDKDVFPFLTSAVQLFLKLGKPQTVTTFVPLQTSPKIQFTDKGLLVDTWSPPNLLTPLARTAP